ncbi:MAG: hypothetical protein WBH00_19885, partial [Xanthobacteraceae bacterium]
AENKEKTPAAPAVERDAGYRYKHIATCLNVPSPRNIPSIWELSLARLDCLNMFVVKFSLAVSVALLCALFAIAPSFGPLRAENTQSAVNAGILRALATRGASHLKLASQNGGSFQ